MIITYYLFMHLIWLLADAFLFFLSAKSLIQKYHQTKIALCKLVIYKHFFENDRQINRRLSCAFHHDQGKTRRRHCQTRIWTNSISYPSV
jgi:hypothetical protein